jgi:hypothetical protein
MPVSLKDILEAFEFVSSDKLEGDGFELSVPGEWALRSVRSCFQTPFFSGTGSSNPLPSSGESEANSPSAVSIGPTLSSALGQYGPRIARSPQHMCVTIFADRLLLAKVCFAEPTRSDTSSSPEPTATRVGL